MATDRVPWKQFLEMTPPGQRRYVDHLTSVSQYGGQLLASPALDLFCDNEKCGEGGGNRVFESLDEEGDHPLPPNERVTMAFLRYQCRNCEVSLRAFAVLVVREASDHAFGAAEKFGEIPPFGRPTPPRLLRLLGDEKELFLAGRRSENQALGIGAYAYYRRIVENQRNRLFGDIRKVAERTASPKEILIAIDDAIADTQFLRSLDRVKDALPSSLLLDAHHNPLGILHAALSEDLHNASDEACLEAAQTVRTALVALTDRIGSVLKDESGVLEAFSKFMSRRRVKDA